MEWNVFIFLCVFVLCCKNIQNTENILFKTPKIFCSDMAVRDLSICADSFNGELKYYRDSNGLEVYAILKLKNGEYGAIKIKIASENNIKDGISSLNRFEKKMKENGLKLPAFKMILTSHGFSKKEGDIYIVPISMLGL